MRVDDVHRSVRRYVAVGLGPLWTVRLVRQEVPDDTRPLAVVERAGPKTNPTPPRMTVPAGDVDEIIPFSILAYPALGATPNEAYLAAASAQQRLGDIFELGLVNDDASSISPPLAVPLYDYSAVPITGGQAGPATPRTYGQLADLATRAIQDPENDLRYTVACDIRVRWWRGGRRARPAPTATRMPGKWDATP